MERPILQHQHQQLIAAQAALLHERINNILAQRSQDINEFDYLAIFQPTK